MPFERARIAALLDEVQAAERAGAEALGQWLTACADPRLRGGLRVIRARDASHATLTEARLRALGGVPAARPAPNLTAICGVLAAPDVPDGSKIALLLARFPAPVYDPFADVIRQIERDSETRALLEAIGDDERSSLGWLRAMKDEDALEGGGGAGRERERAVRFLDAARVAEAASAEVFGAWIAACSLAGLRGGLRAIAAREATHAALLAERLHELGASSCATLAPPVRAAALARLGARDVPDEEKLALVLSRHPDEASAAQPFAALAGELSEDLETREMLRLMAAGEGATIAWLLAYRAAAIERQPSRALASGD